MGDENVIDGNDGSVICSGDWHNCRRVHPGKDDPGCAEAISGFCDGAVQDTITLVPGILKQG